MDKSMEVAEKKTKLKIELSYNPTILLLSISPMEVKEMSQRYLYTHINSTSIYKSQEMEAPQLSISGWMDKESVEYIYNGLLYSLNKKKILELPWWSSG